MVSKKQEPKKIESIVRRIIAFYIDSAKNKNADYLILYLAGGKIPEAAVKVLRPILQSMIDENSEFGSGLTQADFDALEQLRGEVEALYKRRAATRRALKEAINSPQWSKTEQAHAARFELKLLPAEDRMLDLLAQEVVLSDFTAEQIRSTFHNETASVVEFSGRWYADCTNCDYGEEWDPAEGNQQEDNPPGEVLGIGQGFMVSYIILYLYAANVPDKLVGFYKRQKMAHGKKVAKDVLRIYRQTQAEKS
jgi:hypothetical protein